MEAACNLGPRGVRARWLGGILTLVATVAFVASPWFTELAAPWRLLLAAPLFVAFLCCFQAEAST